MTSIRRRIPRPPLTASERAWLNRGGVGQPRGSEADRRKSAASHPLARLFGGLQGDRSEARNPAWEQRHRPPPPGWAEARGPGLRGPRSQPPDWVDSPSSVGNYPPPDYERDYPGDLFDRGRSAEADVAYPEQWVAPSAAALAQGVELSDPQDTWGPEREMGPPGQPPVDPSSMLLQALAQLLGSAPGQLPRRRRPGPGRVPFE